MMQSSLTFRVFVSSTFDDLADEREALHRHVFDRLRDLCRSHGCRFQAIDLRWGISQEASHDQRTMAICLEEIARCQQVTPRPNFMVLLGDRYGWQPVPAEIPSGEFDLLIGALDLSDRAYLTEWYERDANAVPPVHVLRARPAELSTPARWEEEVERPLRRALRRACGAISMPAAARRKYETSATEQEIWRGLLDPDLVHQAAEHVFCFFREIQSPDGRPITDLASFDEKLGRFLDLAAPGQVDVEAATRLSSLKRELRARLGPDNVHEYKAYWRTDLLTVDHIGALPGTLEACLNLEAAPRVTTLCRDVWNRLSKTILAEIDRLEQQDPLQLETDAHLEFGRRRGAGDFFRGRTEPLSEIFQYVAADTPTPLIIEGEAGIGKTALMARAADELRLTRPHADLITRFVGATPSASNGNSLLRGICRDLAARYGRAETQTLNSGREMGRAFLEALAWASAQRPVVIFIDALDELAGTDDLQYLSWFPATLPPHARLVVTVTPGETLAALRQRVAPTSFVRLAPLSVPEGRCLLDHWSGEAGRTLQEPQRDAVLARFEAHPRPLYLKLLFEQARRWRSGDPIPELGADTAHLIEAVLLGLTAPTRHGPVLVAHALAYLAAPRFGISEDQLLDLLSHDVAVMAEFRHRSPRSPASDRLPMVVWARLLMDIAPYLASREAYGVLVFAFYHRAFERAVRRLFLDGAERTKVYDALQEYFGGPPAAKHVTESAAAQVDRQHLAELPFLQTRAGRWDRLETTLTDGPFLEAKLSAGQGLDLLEDYARAQAASVDEADLPSPKRAVADRCALVGRLFGNVVDLVGIEPTSVTAQLLLELQEQAPEAASTFRPRWEAANRNRPWLERFSVSRRYAMPYVAQAGLHQEYLHSLTFSSDSRSLLFFDREGTVVRWDWGSGGRSRTSAPSPPNRIVRGAAVVSDRELLVSDESAVWLLQAPDLWHGNLAAGVWRVVYEAEPGHRISPPAACLERGYGVFAEDGKGSGKLWRFRSGADSCEVAWRLPHAGTGLLVNHIAFGSKGALRAIAYGSGDLVVNTGFYGRAHQGGAYEATFLGGRDTLATVGDDGTLALWDVRHGLIQRRVLVQGAADCVDYCSAKNLFAVGHRSGAVTLFQFSGEELQEGFLYPGVRGWVLCVRFSPCGRHLAVAGRSGIVRLLNVEAVCDEISRNEVMFQGFPQGPIEQATCLLPARTGFFLNQDDHLWSTGPDVDSVYLPLKCETFCVSPERGVIALLAEDLRVLDRASGRPLHIHPLPMANRLAAVLSAAEDRLAVLESGRLVVYALGEFSTAPQEICAVSLDALRAAAGAPFQSQRKAVPLCFCDNGHSVALPLEDFPLSKQATDGRYAGSWSGQRMCLVDVSTGRLVWSLPYQGFCTSLAEVPARRAVAMGLGTGRVYLLDDARKPQGSYFQPSDEPCVVVLAVADGSTIRRLSVPAADGGVSALSADPGGDLLLIGCRSGRVRMASLQDGRGLASVVLPAPVLGFAGEQSATHCCVIDDGSTAGNWPVLHEMVLRLPHETAIGASA
jgi:WD40 repeat protein